MGGPCRTRRPGGGCAVLLLALACLAAATVARADPMRVVPADPETSYRPPTMGEFREITSRCAALADEVEALREQVAALKAQAAAERRVADIAEEVAADLRLRLDAEREWSERLRLDLRAAESLALKPRRAGWYVLGGLVAGAVLAEQLR